MSKWDVNKKRRTPAEVCADLGIILDKEIKKLERRMSFAARARRLIPRAFPQAGHYTKTEHYVARYNQLNNLKR